MKQWYEILFDNYGNQYRVHISMRKVLADYNRGTNQSIAVPFRGRLPIN